MIFIRLNSAVNYFLSKIFLKIATWNAKINSLIKS
jgi:hypothetical protein